MDIIVLELILVAVVALGLGFWQLYDVNRELRKDRDKDGHAVTDRGQNPTEDADAQDK